MPLQQVLASIPPVPGSFDVVIVDEASQADIANLFLLWLAPRVIVVGDDKQCAPAEIRSTAISTRCSPARHLPAGHARNTCGDAHAAVEPVLDPAHALRSGGPAPRALPLMPEIITGRSPSSTAMRRSSRCGSSVPTGFRR